MERGHLSRAIVFAAALAAAATAAAAAAVQWSVILRGTTTPGKSQAPVGYVSVTRAGERAWLSRLTQSDRANVGRLNLMYSGAVAVFLDGLPCSSRVTVTHVTRTSRTLTVRLVYTRAPVGVATCVRTSIPYFVIGVSRRTLGKPAPTHVVVSASARA